MNTEQNQLREPLMKRRPTLFRVVPRLLALMVVSLSLAAAEPDVSDPKTMSDTTLLATVRQLTEQKAGLTKYALPGMSGKAKEFAQRFAAVATQADTKMKDLAAASVSTAADASSPTLPDKVSAVQGLEGSALNAAYVKSMLDLSHLLLPLFEQMDTRSKNPELRSFGRESMEVERKQVKDLEALSAEP